MRLSYIGHATFLIESDGGTRILMDPFRPGAFGKFKLRPFQERVDVVVSSHPHIDHDWIDPSFGTPAVLRAPGRAAGIDFAGLKLPHDAVEGAKRGFVTGFRFEVDGVSVFHPGDLGRPLTCAEADRLGRVDVLLLPVGGTFTIGPDDGVKVMASLHPAFVVPMHYKHPAVDLPLLPLDAFLSRVPGCWERVAVQPVRFERPPSPGPTRVIVLDPTHSPDRSASAA